MLEAQKNRKHFRFRIQSIRSVAATAAAGQLAHPSGPAGLPSLRRARARRSAGSRAGQLGQTHGHSGRAGPANSARSTGRHHVKRDVTNEPNKCLIDDVTREPKVHQVLSAAAEQAHHEPRLGKKTSLVTSSQDELGSVDICVKCALVI